MAENDIYNSKRRYESFLEDLERLLVPGDKNQGRGKRKYHCKNSENLKYFRELHDVFEMKDTSYVRRMKIFQTLLFTCHATGKDLKECKREDINKIVALSHKTNKTPNSKRDYIRILKSVWKELFPELDGEGRVDESLVPYPVRHLSSKVDRSRERRRDDKLTWEEYERFLGFFSSDARMQCLISLAVESLARPQELCYLRIRDLELGERYAKLHVSEHGKEGTKVLQCIDSFPYLIKWYGQHPHRKEGDAFLFVANGRKDRQLTPTNINKKIREACNKLGISKRITSYSLKRNGVTFARLQGESDVEIQHKAGWTSTQQLKTYDLSNSDDTFKKQLAKRGLISEEGYKHLLPETKECLCGAVIGFAESVCPKCKQVTDRKVIKMHAEADDMVAMILEKLAEKNKSLIIEAIEELGLKEKIAKV